MALTIQQQIIETLKKSNYVLIIFKKLFEPDSLASALALSLLLTKMNKTFDVVCDNITINEHLKFLPNISAVSPKLEELQKLIISIELKNNEVDQFSYDIKDDHLNIYITPKHNSFQKENIKNEFTPYKYDLIFVLDSSDLASLGTIYDNHADFFYKTPVINIDHHPSNENFGQMQYVDINSSSTAEILYGLISEMGKEYFDKDIATCLLAGIISKTKSYTSKNVTPLTLQIAKDLMQMDADRTTIIKNLYRNKTVSTLNLWGRVLARLKSDSATHLSWSVLSENDFIESSTTEKNLEGIVDEFIKDIAGVEIMVLFYQKGQNAHVIINSIYGKEDAFALASDFKPQGSKSLSGFILANTHITDAEKKVIENIQLKLQKKS